MNEPDLSFTQDPAWIEKREEQWSTFESELKENLNRKKVKSIRNFFFQGVFKNTEPLSDGALLIYYPLDNAEGWDYVYSTLVRNKLTFRDKFYASTEGSSFPYSDGLDLAYFDYYHAGVYSPIVSSRVPISGEVVSLNVNIAKLAEGTISSLVIFVERDKYSFLLSRLDYIYSIITALKDEDLKVSTSLVALLTRLMEQSFEFKPDVEIHDPSRQLEFLKDFSEKMETLELDNSVKALWSKTKAEFGRV